uniref:Uncharacterized protein n=1 Tax=Anguilla anguilla TaxID=7936 RepID=A0A0E9SIS5_ANGAN
MLSAPSYDPQFVSEIMRSLTSVLTCISMSKVQQVLHWLNIKSDY